MSDWKIIARGEAQTKYPNLEELDGISDQESFSAYFDGDESYADSVSGGYMSFEYKDSKLWTITEYFSTRELTDKELEDLKEYTQGQWSDGIGEGFVQRSCYESDIPYQQWTDQELKDIEDGKYDDDPSPTTEVFISPWFHGQTITIKQQLN